MAIETNRDGSHRFRADERIKVRIHSGALSDGIVNEYEEDGALLNVRMPDGRDVVWGVERCCHLWQQVPQRHDYARMDTEPGVSLVRTDDPGDSCGSNDRSAEAKCDWCGEIHPGGPERCDSGQHEGKS